MNKIALLDCTLRDGGYVNDWKFGKLNMISIVQKLVQSGTEVIECGYLSEQEADNPEAARFNCLENVKEIYALNKGAHQQYAVMINYGEFPVEKLEPADENSPIIRLAFHKKDILGAFQYFNELEKRGYSYFIQPMGSLNYSDEEFVELIKKANTTKAKAFYIVDSFGVMEIGDFRRLLFLADNNLDKRMYLGYHSHNNLQQAYSNAKYMVEQNLAHNIIIDASVFGMGRGAGNLNIELFAKYLNSYMDKQYDIESFLVIFDECLKPIFMNCFWGYSLPFYLSSIHNCHPNYASYFSEKNTLTIKSMHELLSMISDKDKSSFSKEKADQYYFKYQENYIDDRKSLEIIQLQVLDRTVLILAPGKSLKTNHIKIDEFIKTENPVVLGVNKTAPYYDYDFLFITNEKRLDNYLCPNVKNRILTSNLKSENSSDIYINYSSYLSKTEKLYDNPTLMLINLLKTIGVKRVFIAGFDGFTANSTENYFEDMSLGTNLATKIAKNEEIKQEIKNVSKLIEINFLTESLYQ